MTIQFTCQCGKSYRVTDDAAGRRVKCKQCSAVQVVPELDEPDEPEVLGDLQADLHHIQNVTHSAASNPGMLRVSRWRYVRAFPFWAIIWHVPLLAFVLLVFVNWLFIIPTLFFIAAVYLYWRRVKYNFIGGCINPGIIFSLDPPLIAVLTDLTKGDGQYSAVKVLPQPLHRMCSSAPVLGQRVATIAGYVGVHAELEHWDDFEPIVPDLVTADRSELERVFSSISAEDWQLLTQSLAQLPRPLSVGLYRVYDFNALPAVTRKSEHEIVQLINNHLSACRMSRFAHQGIPETTKKQASRYVPPEAMPGVAVIIESCSLSSDAGEGIAMTGSQLFYNFPETGSGSFFWIQLAGALLNDAGVEVTLRDRTRIQFPKQHVSIKTRIGLELLLNEIVTTPTIRQDNRFGADT